MKKFFLALLISMVAFFGTAQDTRTSNPFLFSIGVEGALPVGDFGNLYSFGIGGSVQGEYKPSADVGITLNAGYITYSGKDFGILKVRNYGLVPLLAGVKYYFNSGVYAHGQLGAGFETNGGSGTNFMYTPGIGYLFSPGFDAELKYVGISIDNNKISGNSIGLRIAYNF